MKFLKNKILEYLKYKGYVIKKKSYFENIKRIPSLNKTQKKILSISSKLTMTPKIRQYALLNLLDYIFKKNIEGDLVECGVWF